MLSGEQLTVRVKNKYLLNAVDFHIKPHEFVVIVGPNGAGKSSLLKALSGDLILHSGYVRLNSRVIQSYTISELAQLRAVLTQNYEIDFPFRVKEVIEMAHFSHHDKISKTKLDSYTSEAMHLLGVNHLSKHYFTHLSGGEKQRAQLARVLCQIMPKLKLNKSVYMLIDEPTASLDLYHQYEVMRQAKKIAAQGAGVVAVVHDLSLAASFADRVYMLNQGEVVKSGTPEQVLNEKRLAEVYNINARLNSESEETLPHLLVNNV